MDEALQRLLTAEQKAEEITHAAEHERERLVQSALAETRKDVRKFEERIPELHASFVDRAKTRAQQTTAELKKRFDEQHAQLRDQSEANSQDALAAAFSVLIDSEIDSSP